MGLSFCCAQDDACEDAGPRTIGEAPLPPHAVRAPVALAATHSGAGSDPATSVRPPDPAEQHPMTSVAVGEVSSAAATTDTNTPLDDATFSAAIDVIATTSLPAATAAAGAAKDVNAASAEASRCSEPDHEVGLLGQEGLAMRTTDDAIAATVPLPVQLNAAAYGGADATAEPPATATDVAVPLPVQLDDPTTARRQHHRRQVTADIQNFVDLHRQSPAKMKRSRRRASLVVGPNSATADSLDDIDFEISWAMYNYYSALGDPTRAWTGISHTQWRRFCKASSTLKLLGTAAVDLVFRSALNVKSYDHSGAALAVAEEMAQRTNSPRNSDFGTHAFSASNNAPAAAIRGAAAAAACDLPAVAAAAASPTLSQRKHLSGQKKSDLTFVQFFAALHELAIKVALADKSKQNEKHSNDASGKFIENYLFPLASELMGALKSTSATRRESVKLRLRVPSGGGSTSTLRLIKPNRKLLGRIFNFYRGTGKNRKYFTYASLLAFAKDFSLVPDKITHAGLQRLMHDVKMADGSGQEENKEKGRGSVEKRGSSGATSSCSSRAPPASSPRRSSGASDSGGSGTVSQGELSYPEFEQVLVAISQAEREAQTSVSKHLDADLVKLLRHLEFGTGREKMAHRAAREHRPIQFSSSSHFTFPKKSKS